VALTNLRFDGGESGRKGPAMNSPLDFSTVSRLPTADRPLAGQHILVIEDSRYTCEALRLLCLRSGARIRRADCLHAGRRHLSAYRPGVLIVDLGLPDGDGTDLIREAAGGATPIDVIVAISGDSSRADEALAAGAHLFMEKPLSLIDKFQAEIVALLPDASRPKGMRVAHGEEVHPDDIAFQDDMARVAEVLAELPDAEMLDYAQAFLAGVARSAGDRELEQATIDLSARRASGEAYVSQLAYLQGLVQHRLTHARETI
jgi:DNA-binding response OmpR family regulator